MSVMNFPNGIASYGVPVLGGQAVLSGGKHLFVNYATGSDRNAGTSWDKALKTITAAYAKCTAGKNDVVYVIGNGQSTGSQRLSSTLTWAKDATHLIGVSTPGRYSQRSRIAPLSGATAFSPLMTVSADGCIIANLQFFHGFVDEAGAGICLNVTGERNFFEGCHIAGMGHAEMGDNAGSSSLSLTGNGENTFRRCTIGLNTIARSTTNAEIDLKSAAVRNYFEDCDIVTFADNAGHLFVKADSSGDLDRETIFSRCRFLNSVCSTATAMTGALSVHASAGGLILLDCCTLVGATDWVAGADNANVYLAGHGQAYTGTANTLTGLAHTFDLS